MYIQLNFFIIHNSLPLEAAYTPKIKEHEIEKGQEIGKSEGQDEVYDHGDPSESECLPLDSTSSQSSSLPTIIMSFSHILLNDRR